MSGETALDFAHKLKSLWIKSREEGEDDARSACPFDTLGYTRDTMAHYNATQYREVEQIVLKVA